MHGKKQMNKLLYEFDSKGFITFDRIGDSELKKMREHTNNLNQPKFEFIHLDPPLFTEFWSRPNFRNLLKALCGDLPRYDGHFGVTIPGTPINIHGGPGSHQQATWYSNQINRILTTNLKVGIALSDSDGFGYLPGSHKASFDIQNGKAAEPGKFVDACCLNRPSLRAGDLFMFTDALLHGTLDDKPRKTLYYTFTPGFVCLHVYKKPLWKDLVNDENQKLVRCAGVAIPDENDRSVVRTMSTI